jgi:transcriptional regulator with XRE-family HTH domain
MMTPAQCRAARALLDWSQQQLADAARVGVVTVRQFEAAAAKPRNSTLDVLCRALESAGVEFMNGSQPGVKARALDLEAIELSSWSNWQIAASQADAVSEVRKLWLSLPGQSSDTLSIWFAADIDTNIRVGEVQPLGEKWRYRYKPKLYLPLAT